MFIEVYYIYVGFYSIYDLYCLLSLLRLDFVSMLNLVELVCRDRRCRDFRESENILMLFCVMKSVALFIACISAGFRAGSIPYTHVNIRVVATTPEKTHNQKFLTFETIFNRFFVQF